MASLLLLAVPFASAREKPFMAYHASWYELPAIEASQTTLSRLPGYMNIVALAFARPDMVYEGDLDISRTGLQYSFSGEILRDTIALLKKRHPDTRVIISVGGAGWQGWDRFNEHALARLVKDVGADGVDLDYEPSSPNCLPMPNGRISCASDDTWIELVKRTRMQMPRPYLLTLPGWSVGAYGEGEFTDEGPKSPWTGSMLNLLRSDAAPYIDYVSIMAYDAGPDYDPSRAFAAYRTAWKGPLLAGIAVMPLISDGTLATPETINRKVAHARHDANGGAMLYVLRDCPPEANCAPHVDYREVSRSLCKIMGAKNCESPVP
ncbi:glycosyl hydrolase family 18 protein [Pseudochelatococcus sp. G4_1912]|uniref:glycosyl hydrolase family 18 protein n=1 Tax=Pseudochelatococcus sp. G4_1912 TaxID=3114288 RepID=UPI0039C6831E